MVFAAVRCPVDEPVRVQGVRHRVAFAQEFRIPDQRGAGLRFCQHLGQPRGGSHRHRGFPGDDVAGGELGGEGRDGGIHVAQVRAVFAALLRRSDADEVDLGAAGGRHVGGEPQPARVAQLREEVIQRGFVERGLARGQLRHLVFVQVDADNVVPQPCHGGRMDRAEITATDNRDPHSCRVLPPWIVHSVRAGSGFRTRSVECHEHQGREGADHGAEGVRGDVGDGGKARREEDKLGELNQDRDGEADGNPAPPQPCAQDPGDEGAQGKEQDHVGGQFHHPVVEPGGDAPAVQLPQRPHQEIGCALVHGNGPEGNEAKDQHIGAQSPDGRTTG